MAKSLENSENYIRSGNVNLFVSDYEENDYVQILFPNAEES